MRQHGRKWMYFVVSVLLFVFGKGFIRVGVSVCPGNTTHHLGIHPKSNGSPFQGSQAQMFTKQFPTGSYLVSSPPTFQMVFQKILRGKKWRSQENSDTDAERTNKTLHWHLILHFKIPKAVYFGSCSNTRRKYHV